MAIISNDVWFCKRVYKWRHNCCAKGNNKENEDNGEDRIDFDSIDNIEETMGRDVADILRDYQQNWCLGTNSLTTQ